MTDSSIGIVLAISVLNDILVLATVVILYKQLRRFDRSQAVSTYATVTSQFLVFFGGTLQTPEALRIYFKGKQSPESLSPDQRQVFEVLVAMYLTHHESMLFLQRTGGIPSGYFEGWKNDLRKNLRTPGFQQYLAHEADEYSPEFRSFLASLGGEASSS